MTVLWTTFIADIERVIQGCYGAMMSDRIGELSMLRRDALIVVLLDALRKQNTRAHDALLSLWAMLVREK